MHHKSPISSVDALYVCIMFPISLQLYIDITWDNIYWTILNTKHIKLSPVHGQTWWIPSLRATGAERHGSHPFAAAKREAAGAGSGGTGPDANRRRIWDGDRGKPWENQGKTMGKP